MWGFESLRPCQLQTGGRLNAGRGAPWQAPQRFMKEAKVEPRVVARESKTGAAFGGWFSNLRTWPKQTKTFLGDVRAETQKVTWPTRSMVKATTVVVIVTVFFFGLYFAILDYFFSELVGRLLRWGG